jgi:hypothetical protein
VPFDKQNETLVPGAGSCSNCPRRPGFNKLLFADLRKDSCTDPHYFRAKIGARFFKHSRSQAQFLQISSTWNTREGAPLGRNRYLELQVKKANSNGVCTKQVGFERPCEKMTEAIVMDGGKRGQIVKVCADLSCRVNHQTILTLLPCLNGSQNRSEARVADRGRTIGQLPHKHKTEFQLGQAAQERRQKEFEFCARLSDVARNQLAGFSLPTRDALVTTARRYRVDIEKLGDKVAAEFIANRTKQTKSKAAAKKPAVARQEVSLGAVQSALRLLSFAEADCTGAGIFHMQLNVAGTLNALSTVE